jgi:hypothetical protein
LDQLKENIMSKYGGTIEKMKAKRAAAMRLAAKIIREAKEARSRAEVALDEVHDDLVLQGLKEPTPEQCAEVLAEHVADQEEDYRADFNQDWGGL